MLKVPFLGMAKQKKTIFITGGVLSSIGKGISAASIGMLMEQRGMRVSMLKMDPYINIDPGTMSPLQHGEVFVLDDGSETDLDLGHYSRFVRHASFTKKNSFTTGRVYDAVIRRERAGGYLGKTVQVIPHITDEIQRLIREATEDAEVAIVEVGGTVGDIEGLPFLEAIRQMRTQEGVGNVLVVHLTLVPYIAAARELKTKPTQHSVRELRAIGIQPDILLCRSDRTLPKDVKDKIGLFCSVPGEQVFSAKDVASIYEVPLYFHEEGLDEKIIELLGIWSPRPDLGRWQEMVTRLLDPSLRVLRIGIIGKYTDAHDSYKSLSEALAHAAGAQQARVDMIFVDAEAATDTALLASLDGILVPGGFGERGVAGKIAAIRYAREHSIPYFGICLGMQLMVIEYARSLGMLEANSSEFQPDGAWNVVDFMPGQSHDGDKGASMRLGAYTCDLKPETLAHQAYDRGQISERHRHRFEVSPKFSDLLQEKGLIVSGTHNDKLVEIVELPGHPWFLGCQFHPEFLSHPLAPHPLFLAFLEAAGKK